MGILAILAVVFNWLLTSTVGRMILLAEVVVLGFIGYTLWIEHKTHVADTGKELAAIQAESTRRLGILDQVQGTADKAVQNIAALEQQNEKLKSEIARLSAANRSKPCFDAAAGDRLRNAGRRSPGGGTQQSKEPTPSNPQ